MRVVWLRSEKESDIVFTTSHRICDGMSMLTVVRETLRLLYLDEELIPYAAITTRDMMGRLSTSATMEAQADGASVKRTAADDSALAPGAGKPRILSRVAARSIPDKYAEAAVSV